MQGHDILWRDGTFVLPHHFQQNQLHVNDQISDILEDYIPHQEGVVSLDISETAYSERHIVEIETLHCRMPDGTRIHYERHGFKNADIEPCSFQGEIDSCKGFLTVYLALSRINYEGPYVSKSGGQTRFIAQEVPLTDLVSGNNEATIQTKILKPRILFSKENLTGCVVLPLARITVLKNDHEDRVSIDHRFIPPCISVQMVPALKCIYEKTAQHLNKKYKSLRSLCHSWSDDILYTQKLQSLAIAYNSFKQLQSLGHKLHPFTLYTKMAEIIGALIVFDHANYLAEVPVYDHHNLSGCFEVISRFLWDMLDNLKSAPPYEMIAFERIDADCIGLKLQPEWLDENKQLVICLHSSVESEEVVRCALRRLKVAPQDLLTELNKRRLPGFSLTPLPVEDTMLHGATDKHYFEILRQQEDDNPGPCFRDLKEDLTLVIWGYIDFVDNAHLLIVDKTTRQLALRPNS